MKRDKRTVKRIKALGNERECREKNKSARGK